MRCPRCQEEISREVTGCPYCMQAIDDVDRPPPEAEEKPEEKRTPLDEFVLTYLARREIWLLGSILLSPLAVGLGIAGIRLTNNEESAAWTARYLRLGSIVLGSFVFLFCVKHFWPSKPYPVVVEATGQHQIRVMVPGLTAPLERPRKGYEWIVVRATVRVEAPEGKKGDEDFTHVVSQSQFHMVTSTDDMLVPVSDTMRFGEEAFPNEPETMRMGQSASGVLLFMAKEAPPTTKLVYEADLDPESGKPRFRREFEISASAPIGDLTSPTPSQPQAPTAAPMPGSSYREGGAAMPTQPAAPMPGSSYREGGAAMPTQPAAPMPGSGYQEGGAAIPTQPAAPMPGSGYQEGGAAMPTQPAAPMPGTGAR